MTTNQFASTEKITSWSELLQQLLDGETLTTTQAGDLMQGWLNDTIPPALSAGILIAMQAKGVCVDELVGMAKVLQTQSFGYTPEPTPVIDTCGTGGDRAATFNISTAVAFVAAAAGVRVAKHGSRSVSSRTGSADVLEALGVNLNASHEKIQAAVREIGITFLYAPGWHPGLKTLAPLRQQLKTPTVLNYLGPLVNPLRPKGQIVGVNHQGMLKVIAGSLSQLGCERAIALHGREKLDEAGLADLTDLVLVQNHQTISLVLNPKELNLTPAPTTALRGGDVQENADILRLVLQGKGTQAQRDIVALNTALALYVGGRPHQPEDIWTAWRSNLSLAQQILHSGAAWAKLQELVKFLR